MWKDVRGEGREEGEKGEGEEEKKKEKKEEKKEMEKKKKKETEKKEAEVEEDLRGSVAKATDGCQYLMSLDDHLEEHITVAKKKKGTSAYFAYKSTIT